MLNNSYKKVAISKSTNTGTTSVTVARNNNTIKLNGIAVSGNTIQNINLVYMIMPTITKNGITFTNNGDGTITADGTATSKSVFYFCGGLSTTGNLLLLGCPSGGSNKSYNLEVRCYDNEGGKYYLADFGNGVISKKQISKFTDVYIVIQKGQTVSNLTFKPQLCDLTVIYGEGNEPTTVEQFLKDYPDYEPYQRPSPTNPVSIKNSNDNGVSIALQGINLLDKNKFPATQTINGITFTNNGDGTITVDGTAGTESSWAIFRLDSKDIFIQKSRQYLMMGCPSNGSTETYFLRDGWNSIKPDTGNGMISSSIGTKSAPMIQVFSGTTVSNLVFKPELFDLTAIYGEGNEPTTVEQFYRDYPDYEPYFNKTVEIPSSVTLSDGTSFSINLAKVGDKADKLSVKGSKAIYSQSTEKITLTGEESGWSEAEGVYKYSLGKALIENSGYCTHFKLSDTGEENTFGVENGGITFKTDAATGLDNFRVWLKAQSDAGNAVQVTVALASPVEYDLSDTALGQSLLSLASGSYAQTVIAKSDSTIPTSEISVDSTHQYESYKTIRYVHETPLSENSSNLQINNSKAIMTINSLELTGGAMATTEDIVVTRSGKNLLDGNLRTTPKTQNGITIQYLPDEDCYLFDGTCTANTSHYLITHNLFVNGRITASMVVISGTCEGTAQFSISYRDNLSETTFPLWVTKNIVNGNLSINQGVHKYIGATWFYIAEGTSFNNYKIKIQIELGTVVTEYEPYLPPKSLTFSRDYLLSLKGANNLFDKDTFYATQTKSGITWTNNGDGTITANGTAVEGSIFYNIGPALSHNVVIGGHKALIRGCPKNDSGGNIVFALHNQGYDNLKDYGGGKIGTIDGSLGLNWGVAWYGTPTFDNLVFKPELYDLTAIYGEGNEPTTVEQFLKTYPLSSTDKLTITKNSVKYNNVDITEQVTGLSDFMATNTETAIIDTNYTMGSISADVKKLFVSYKKSIYQANEQGG